MRAAAATARAAAPMGTAVGAAAPVWMIGEPVGPGGAPLIPLLAH